MLIGLRGGEVFARSDFVCNDAQRLFQKLAGLKTVSAGVALGLNRRITFRRHGDFDDTVHSPSVCFGISTPAATARYSSTAGKRKAGASSAEKWTMGSS